MDQSEQVLKEPATGLIRYNSIGLFHDTNEWVQETAKFLGKPLPTIVFRGTTKINGTNRSVVFHGPLCEYVHFQSKETILIPGDKRQDPHGFATFVMEDSDVLDELRNMAVMARVATNNYLDPVQIYGEWAGPGICGKVTNAVEHLPNAHFFIFGVRVSPDNTTKNFIPLDSVWMLSTYKRLVNVDHLGEYKVIIDFNNPEDGLAFVEQMTLKVEAKCPSCVLLPPGLQHTTGEGLVWVAEHALGSEEDIGGFDTSKIVFKSKGVKHKKGKRTLTVNADPVKAANVAEFVASALEDRLDQGIRVLVDRCLPISQANFPEFVKWLLADIEREEAAAMQVSDITMDDISKPVGKAAHTFYRSKL